MPIAIASCARCGVRGRLLPMVFGYPIPNRSRQQIAA
jgi:hypothetical protein